MFPLEGKVQHYAWGGKMFIPSLLGETNTEQIPFAEFWMGVHPSAPAQVETSVGLITLPDLVASSRETYLGERLMKTFKDLPFLLKILDVREMLSIQVHPSKDEALIGFRRENDLGIPLDAPNRNYKDANHKPEMMVALSDFWLLHGFKSMECLKETLQSIPEFRDFVQILEQKGYRGLYQYIMEMGQAAVDQLLTPLANRILPVYEQGGLSKSSPDFWAARAMKTYKGHMDRGIFSIYFFNLVNLKKGEAIFQGAGLPHAYLEGQNVELMSNSDNVLRGGLTPKHVDVEELMKHMLFEAIIPQKMTPVVSGPEQTFYCPVPDFGLKWIHLSSDQPYQLIASSPEIVFALDGTGTIAGKDFSKGMAFFVTPNECLRVEGTITFVRAFVP